MNAAIIGTGQLLFVTHEAFLRLPEFDRKRNWRLIHLEIGFFEFVVVSRHELFSSAIGMVLADASMAFIMPVIHGPRMLSNSTSTDLYSQTDARVLLRVVD
jgi:hypothetical protein